MPGEKEKAAPAKDEKQAGAHKAPPKKEAAPKKKATSKTASKETIKEKTVAKKATTGKAAPKKEPSKKEPSKKGPSKKEPSKKEPSKKPAKKASKKKEEEKPAYDGPTSDIKVNVYSIEGKKKGKINLPRAFDTEVRTDLIRNAVTRARANRRQPYGPNPRAGQRHSVEQWGKGRGVARVMRVKGERTGAQSPGTVGGRKAHPPKTEKNWSQKMNYKERHMARMSALSATRQAELVRARGHKFSDELTLPVVIEEDFERMSEDVEEKHYKAMIDVLESLGVYDDVIRAEEGRHQRSGKGKMRGRRFKTPKSILVVVNDATSVRPFFRNMAGVDIVSPDTMSTESLAPGGDPGRLMIISVQALERMWGWN